MTTDKRESNLSVGSRNEPSTGGRRKFRDLRSVMDRSEAGFELAYGQGVMGLVGRPGAGRTMSIRGHSAPIVDFARGSYLGLDMHPDVLEGGIAAMRQYGALQCNTARTRMTFEIADQLEEDLSQLFGCRAVLSSLVLTANMAVLPLIACGAFTGGRVPTVVFDRFAHATLAYHKPVIAEDAEVVTIEHNDLNALEDLCKKNQQVAYVLDGIYSMGGEAPIKELMTLQDRYGLFLYIDDAHGTSVFGKRGEGFAREAIGAAISERTIIVASLGKGFGAAGASLLLSSEEQERLITRYGVPYAFAIGPNTAVIGASLASAKLHRGPELQNRQDRLQKLLHRFDELVDTAQCGHKMPIRMVRLGDDHLAISCGQWLLQRGYYLTAAFYPTVAKGEAGLRLCMTADHSMKDIEAVALLLSAWKAEFGWEKRD
jgi:8-amino-7-oxononanoate synthase